MRVMVLVKSTPGGDQDFVRSAWTDAMLDAMGRFNEALAQAGVLISAEGLKPSRYGKRIRFDGDSRTVSDGPFADPASLVAGYWLWQVRDMDEAVAWAKRCPNPMPEASVIEIRPLYDASDFD